MRKRMESKTLLFGFIAILIAAILVNQYLILSIRSSVGTQQSVTRDTTKTDSAKYSADLQRIIDKVVPKGIPEYGNAASVSFDEIDESLQMLVSYHENIELTGNDFQRYVKIGTTRETACEFCCGIGELGFADKSGNLQCGCAHNIALSGLTKWLIKNTNYTDEQILGAIKEWKGAFFPSPMISKELGKRGIDPQAAGLPAIQGGC